MLINSYTTIQIVLLLIVYINEINPNSRAISIDDIPEKLDENMVASICTKYKLNQEELLDQLYDTSVINRSNKFKYNGCKFDNLWELKMKFMDYVKWYNNLRFRWLLRYMSPVEYRNFISEKKVS